VGVSRWFWIGSLGVLLVVVGLLSLTEWPGRIGIFTAAEPDGWIPIGVLLIAMGEFVIATTAAHFCPRADERIVAALQLGPLVVMLAFFIIWFLF
jgi:hypothetical protein